MGSTSCSLSHGNVMSRGIDTYCGSAMSYKIPCVVEMPRMEKYFHEGFHQVTNEIWHGATPVKYISFN